MRLTSKCIIAALLLVAVVFAAVPAKKNTEACRKITGDEIVIYKAIPYLGGRASPGDSIGTTTIDYQANGGCEKRLYVDIGGQAHVTWMKADLPYAGATRRMEWNFRYADGTYFGEVDASPLTSGYGSLDYTRDVNLADQRSVISYHYNEGGAAGYFGWIDIDGGNGWGSFPNNPQSPRNHNKLWPMVARVNNGNMVLASDDYDANLHHIWTTTDQGANWTYWGNLDSTADIDIFVIASDNDGSNKVAFVNTQYITDTVASGQLCHDVWYMVSTDGGVNWGPYTNLTQYAPADTIRAYDNASAAFDLNDNLHIVWSGQYVDASGYYEASKIFHWDEVNDEITVVSAPTGVFAGGWWGWTNPNGYGGWRLPADEPLLVVDKNSANTLYCLWCGQTDTADVSAAGWPNGDIYGARSIDGGLTWSDYTNLTNTSSPGAQPGACFDEDYISVCPYTVNDSIYLTYIEDKDAGGMPQSEGDTTVNPVRLYVFPKTLLGIEEYKPDKPLTLALTITPNPVSRQSVVTYTVPQTGDVMLKVYGIDGRLVNTLVQGTQAAGVYTQNIDTRQLASGTYFVLLKTSQKQISRSLVIVH